MHFFKTLGVTGKLSIFVVASIILSVGVLGFYFDLFLKQESYSNAAKRMEHAFNRLYSDIKHIEEELKEGIAFIKSDESSLASIELINNYQNKVDYNAILLDEEKKNLAQELLKRVKLSLNDDIALYDHNEDLIAFIVKEEKGYHLNFVSFRNGIPLLLSRYEDEPLYHEDSYHQHALISFKHANYYNPNLLRHDGVVTHHYFEDSLYIKSHQSIFETEIETGPEHIIAHIEMSRKISASTLKELSQNLDLTLKLSDKTDHKYDLKSLFELQELSHLTISEDAKAYWKTMFVNTVDKKAYFTATFDKAALNTALWENRKKFLLLLLFVVLFTLLTLRYFFTKKLLEPLQQLMHQINRIEEGDYTPSPNVETSDELESISKNINRLAIAVNERESALKASKEDLDYLSSHDALTGLPNRRLFMIRLEHAINQSKRYDKKGALLFLDLDQFKHVNDTLGHDIGDELLIAVAKRLKQTIRATDMLARIGGDEFNILIENIESVRDVEIVVQKMMVDFRTPYTCKQHEINTTASIGISFFPDDGDDSITLIKNADLAMYKAKDEGRNNYSFFSKELSDYLESRTHQINALQSAIREGNEFILLYQPKISLHTHEIAGMEALIRWKSPTLGFVMPDQFIRLAEETGMIIPIGEWIMHQACTDFVTLQNEGYLFDQISINVSNIQLKHSDMVYTLKKIIAQTGIAANDIELEITESFIASHELKALETLQQFRNMHVDLAIDDFGTGYSSLSYLQKLPMTRLKIDKSFVDNLPESQESVAVARAIIALAKTFNLSITAEGVETKTQLDFLLHEQCDEVQGYYYAKPMPYEELKSFYTEFTLKASS